MDEPRAEPAKNGRPTAAVVSEAETAPSSEVLVERPKTRRNRKQKAPPEPALFDDEEEAGTPRRKRLSRRHSLYLIAGLACLLIGVITLPRNDSVPAMLDQGVAAQRSGRVEEAKAIYQDVLRRDPDNAVAKFNLGVAAQLENRPEEAERLYRAALRSEPRFVGPLFNLAILKSNQGENEESERLYLQLIEISPNHAPAHLNLGFLYIDKLNRRADGEAEFRRALELDPSLISRIPADLRPAPPAAPPAQP